MKPLNERDWFQTCHARIGGVISGCIMLNRVTPHTPSEIERQLTKAYNMGRRDGKKEMRREAIKQLAKGIQEGLHHDSTRKYP
jgi:hypothetical protein